MMRQGGEWLERSRQSFQTGRYDAALQEVAEALRLEPQMADAWNLQGAVLKQLGRSPEALNNYDRALTLDPHLVKVWFNKGLLLEELQRYQEAIACYQTVMELQPDFIGMGERLNALQHQNLTVPRTLQTHVTLQIGNGVQNEMGEDAESWYDRGVQQGRAGNLHVALASFDKVLESKPDNYKAWYGRGKALSDLGRCEEALASYDQALGIKPDFPKAWNNRGVILSAGLRRYEEAIASFDQALEIKPDLHRAWINRGNVAVNSSQGKTSTLFSLPAAMQHLTLAQRGYPKGLASYREGLKYVQRKTYPQGWGQLHQAIGIAHYHHGKFQPAPASFYRQAVRAYYTALETLTSETYPEDYLEVVQDLVRVESGLDNTVAAKAYQTKGLQVLQTLLNQSSTFRKRQLELKFSGFRQLTVDVLINTGEPILALQEADRNKNRALNWILEDWQEPTWSPTYPAIQRLLTRDRAILYWHLSPDTLTTFLLQAHAPEPIVSTEPSQPLEDWLKAWNKDYQDYRAKSKETSQHRQTHPWRTNLKLRLAQLQTILQISTLEQQLEGINQLILIPHRQLHQLPLHSLFTKPFTLTHLPSLQVGLNLQQRASGQDAQPTHQAQFLSVENPLNDLEFAEIESVVVQQMFQQTTVLDADAATPQAVQNALENCHGFHFTGHGAYSDRQPQNSALTLANHQPITAQIIQGLNLQPCQLVCLSACETALTGSQSLDTEYVGLVSAFLQAKAAAVVSTLWTVEEVSNAWLVIYFYSQVIFAKQPPVLAMQQAQQWLQTVTYRQLVDWLQHQVSPLVASLPVAKQIADEIQAIQQDTGKIESQTPPYQNPYFWAAFTFTGLFNNSFTERQSA